MSTLVSILLPALLAGVTTQTAVTAPAKTPAPIVKQAGKQPVLVRAPQTPPNAQPAATPAATPAALDKAALLDKAAEGLKALKTAKGAFTQIDDRGGVASGDFYISRPGKVRFDYLKPEPMHIVSDGTTVSIEEPKRGAYDAVPLASTPLNLFLRANIDLKKDGSVTDARQKDGSVFLTLVDKTGETEGKMTLEFRSTDYELLGWRAIDAQGAETSVKLTGLQKNAAVSNALFVVKDPADRRTNGNDRRR
jgi:outer membrane lipoprotein-sorting protein